MKDRLDIVVLGLSLSSSWGNGHATTFRALIKGVHRLGHRVLFLERDVPWYAETRDLPAPPFCAFALYPDVATLAMRHGSAIRAADAVIVGSYVPDGVEVLDLVLSTARGSVAFYDIDTPITLAALGSGTQTYIAPRQIPSLDAYFSFAGGPILAQLQSLGARRALPLHCSVDADLYHPTGAAPRFDLGYLGTYSPDRQPALESLLLEPARRLPTSRFVVGGSGYPPTIAWPENVTRIEHVPPAEHAGFYASQRLTLNITRAEMRKVGWSPSVRLFEAAACGTPVVSDRWPGLESFFPEESAILLADGADEVCHHLYLPQDALDAVARTARSLVLCDHSGEARASALVAYLHSLAGPAPAKTLNKSNQQGNRA